MISYQKKPIVCSIHRQLFCNKGSLVRHCNFEGHVKLDSFLYKMFTLNQRRVRRYSLTNEDEQFLIDQQAILKLNFDESSRDIHRIRMFLPILGLLDMTNSASDANLSNILQYICKKLKISEKEAENVESTIVELQVYKYTDILPKSFLTN